MDNKELLKNVIDGIVNENDEDAKASFKQYATAKVRGLMEKTSLAKKAKKVEDKNAPDCDAEDAANKVIKDSNADD